MIRIDPSPEPLAGTITADCPRCLKTQFVSTRMRFVPHHWGDVRDRCGGSGLRAVGPMIKQLLAIYRRTARVREGMAESLAEGTGLSEEQRARMTAYVEKLDREQRLREDAFARLGAVK